MRFPSLSLSSGLALGVLLAPAAVHAQGGPASDLAPPPAPGAVAFRPTQPRGPAAARANQLYDNGPLITSVGTGAGGADESVLQTTSLSMTLLGTSVNATGGFRLTDDFTIPAGSAWDIEEITFYTYQTGSPPTSTITRLHVEIWDGDPAQPGSTLLFGDLSTNRLVDTAFSDIYRVTETTSGTTARPIMSATAGIGANLPAGTYWLVWQIAGSLPSGPWAPPITVVGQNTTGDAQQYSATTMAWTPVVDGGSLTAQGLPFTICGRVGAQVVINEFQYDDSGTDDREFVELFNRSLLPVDIGGWVLDAVDPTTQNLAYTIPVGTVLAAGDYWVMGSALVPNVDQVVGTTNLWENDNEALTLRDLGGQIVDTLIYESNKGIFDPTLAEGEGVWGNFTSIDGIETSWSRVRDGRDTDDNGDDFRLMRASPGAANALPTIDRSTLVFDAANVGDVVAEFGGSFALGRVIDPTIADVDNPNAIPASPQGGKASIYWDRSGGGNSVHQLADASTDTHLEAWVYFDAAPRPTGESEMWSVGFGTTGTFYNFPDPTGTLGFVANGNTGLAWTYTVDDTGGNLYLIDHGNGGLGAGAGSQPVTLGSIAVQAGVNDGWQRLSLSLLDGVATGRFGGSYGAVDGTTITGPASTGLRGVYFGYREFVTTNANARPLTVDNLLIVHCGPGGVRRIGTAIANGAAQLPTIAVNGPVRPGSTFGVDATGMVPNGIAYLFRGVERASPITLGTSGPAGFALWIDYLDVLSVTVDPNGAASAPQVLPANATFCGIELGYQYLQIDTTIPAKLPLFHTEAVVVRFGG
jgi:hypothetical protein